MNDWIRVDCTMILCDKLIASPSFPVSEILFLSANEFTGPIPTSIGQSENGLRGLYLSENKLEGEIPESICDYVNLEALFVDENRLSGSLPSCLGNLENLKQFYAFKNNLTGEVPQELSSLRKLVGLGLEHNGITGDSLEGFCEVASPAEFWSDCGGDAPELTCPCCTVCCPSDECV